MIYSLKSQLRRAFFVVQTVLWCLVLAGCEHLPQLHLPQSQAQIVFDTAPIADPVVSAPVRVSRSPEENEDPSLLLARDGRFYVVWSSKQRGRVDLFISSSADGRTWSEERRIHDVPAEDYYPALMQSRDGRFHLVWCQLQRKEGRTDVWYTASKDGRVWDKPRSLTNRGIDWAPTIYEDNKGVLRVLWSSRRSGSRDIWMTRSIDGGKTWLSPDQVTRSSEEDDFPHALQAPNGEHYLAWTRYRRGSAMLELDKDKSSDVVLSTSRDAVVWSAPVVSSFGDPDNKFVDILPALFHDPDNGQVFVSWTSGRIGVRRGILARSITSPSSHVFQLTTPENSDSWSRIVPTKQSGEYLMVWVSTREGKPDIFARRLKL